VDLGGRSAETKATSPVPLPSEFCVENWFILPSTSVVRRDIFNQCGGFCEEFKQPGDEDPFILVNHPRERTVAYVPEPLVLYRAPNPADLAVKYAPGHRLFAQLVRKRYVRRARPLIRLNNRFHPSNLIVSAARRLDKADIGGAALDLWRSLLLSPSHCLSGSVITRLLRPASFGRAFKAILHSR
jgi:hypothetical protein